MSGEKRAELNSEAATEVKGNRTFVLSLSFIDTNKTANWTLTRHKGRVSAQLARCCA